MVRDQAGDPVVIRNDPLLDDGTPMPTRYWLLGRSECLAVDRLESLGGVRAAEAAVDPALLATAHAVYAAERDAAIPEGWAGPRPRGGVGGTRVGVKCLHAHYAWHLAGGDDPVGQWVAARLAPVDRRDPTKERVEMADAVVGDQTSSGDGLPVAGIDCGTHSTRLLIAGPDGAPLERLMRITRLGQGVDRNRTLDPAAIRRTVSVLGDYRLLMDRYRVLRVRMTATSAARDAANREDFFAAATAAVGVRPELLGGQEEARLSFVGAMSDLDPAGGPWLVADIGGGSTELAIGPDHQGEPQAALSLDIGCVRITERFLVTDLPSAEQVAAARRHVADVLATASQREPAFASAAKLVGLAGTVAGLAAIDQQLVAYDRDRLHHYLLEARVVEGLLATLAGETADARRRRPGVEAERADVIVGGAIVLAEIMRHFQLDVCLTSEADILDGLAHSQLTGGYRKARGLPEVR